MTRLLLATLVALAATAHSLPVETVEAAEVTTSAATRSTCEVVWMNVLAVQYVRGGVTR